MGNHYWPPLPQTTNRPDSAIWAISTSALSGTDMQIEKPLICRPQVELGYASFLFYIQYLPTIFLNNSLSLCKKAANKISAAQVLMTYTAISRKVVGKNVHATIPKGNMGYDQFAVPDTVAVKTSFVIFL